MQFRPVEAVGDLCDTVEKRPSGEDGCCSYRLKPWYRSTVASTWLGSTTSIYEERSAFPSSVWKCRGTDWGETDRLRNRKDGRTFARIVETGKNYYCRNRLNRSLYEGASGRAAECT